MEQKKYNFVLVPLSTEDREDFWNFRCEDIAEKMIYYIIIISSFALIYLFQFIRE